MDSCLKRLAPDEFVKIIEENALANLFEKSQQLSTVNEVISQSLKN